MENYTLNRTDTLLMIIDIQDKLVPVMDYQAKVIKNNKILLQAALEMGIPAITTEQYPQGLGQTVPELLTLMKPEHVFAKNSFSAFTNEVKTTLKQFDRKKILVTGMETHVCVYQTVRDLIAEGYLVFLVKDAAASRTTDHYLNALDLMQRMGAVITNTETVVFDLLKLSGTSEFKRMLKLIK